MFLLHSCPRGGSAKKSFIAGGSIACVASVSNRVIARKLERKQKKKTNLARKRLLLRLEALPQGPTPFPFNYIR